MKEKGVLNIILDSPCFRLSFWNLFLFFFHLVDSLQQYFFVGVVVKISVQLSKCAMLLHYPIVWQANL